MAAELPPRQMPPELAQLLPSPCQGLFASFCLYCPSFPHLGFTFCHQAKHPPDLCPPPHSHCQRHPKRDEYTESALIRSVSPARNKTA